MEIKDFKDSFEEVSIIPITDEYVVFEDYELFNKETNETIHFKKFDELLDYKINNKTIKEIIEEKEDLGLDLSGGRGASVGKGKKLFTLQGKKGDKKLVGLTDGKGNSFPAYLNVKTGGRYKSEDKTIKTFAKMMDKKLTEYSASVDEQGFATKYNKGTSGNTAFLPIKNGIVVHNHPVYDKKGKRVAWNAFSGQDLMAIASNKKTRGIVATANGNKSIYKFTKKKNFKAKEFVKGLSSAKMNSSNYDKDVDTWLRKNAKQYGYSYSRRKYQ